MEGVQESKLLLNAMFSESAAIKYMERSREGMPGFGGALAPSTLSLRAAASCLLVRAEERKGTCGF